MRFAVGRSESGSANSDLRGRGRFGRPQRIHSCGPGRSDSVRSGASKRPRTGPAHARHHRVPGHRRASLAWAPRRDDASDALYGPGGRRLDRRARGGRLTRRRAVRSSIGGERANLPRTCSLAHGPLRYGGAETLHKGTPCQTAGGAGPPHPDRSGGRRSKGTPCQTAGGAGPPHPDRSGGRRSKGTPHQTVGGAGSPHPDR